MTLLRRSNMFDAMRETPAAAASVGKTTSRDEDDSFTVVLAVCALGLLLSLIATAITPDWFFALTM
jgi:hypothetical protein